MDLYGAFNTRDIDLVLPHLHPEVLWHKAWEDEFAHGRDEVRHYWERMWQGIDPQAQPLDVTVGEDGRWTVLVHQVVHDLTGNVLSYAMIEHINRLRDGLIDHMEARTVDGT
jgi:hypothetical protein